MTATAFTAFPDRAKARTSTQAFALFLTLHLLLFTALPTLLTSNLPLDTIEALTWGHEWQWGYYKHPPMSAWLAEIFRFGTHDWSLYALSQVMVVTAFIAAWLLAKDLVGPTLATFAVMALEGIHYHNVTSLEFNANLVMYPFWAWASLAFWRALNTGKPGWWALLGLACGLGTLGKYVLLVLPASMMLFLILHPTGRAQWKRGGPWLAMIAFGVVITPHALWLMDHGAPTLHYAMDRGHAEASQTSSHWARELFNFLGAQALALLPMLGLLALLGWSPRAGLRRPSAEQWALATLGLGPLLLFVAAAVILQINLLHMWAAPLFLTSAPLLLGWSRPAHAHLHGQRFTCGVIAWVLLMVALYTTALVVGPKMKHHADRTDYPGRQLAKSVEQRWHEFTGQSLAIVVGETFIAGNVAAYSTDHPSVYINGKSSDALWLNDELVRDHGAIFVWSKNPSDQALMQSLQARFPNMTFMQDLILTSNIGTHDFKTNVTWAVLLPRVSK